MEFLLSENEINLFEQSLPPLQTKSIKRGRKKIPSLTDTLTDSLTDTLTDSLTDTSPDIDDRRNRNASARRSRLKRKQKAKRNEECIEKLEKENKGLEERVIILNDEKEFLKKMLLNFSKKE